MKKKVLTMLVLSLLLAVGITSAAWAEIVQYPVPGGNLQFDTETGTITECSQKVTEANIPAEINGVAVTAIGGSAFSCCYELTNVTIPDGVTKIGEQAFYACDALTKLTLPEGIEEIGNSAFIMCSKLADINIPKSVTKIGAWAFDSCQNLSDINIPAGVTKIGTGAFSNCEKLAGIQVAADNAEYSSVEGVLFSKDKKKLLQYPNAHATVYVIPGGTTEIADDAFCGCYDLTSVTIPASVTKIGEMAFHDCFVLGDTTIPDIVTEIGLGAFSNCTGLAEITVPGGVNSIADSAFSGCTGLTKVIVIGGVANIAEYAFGYCENLTDITIPASVIEIDKSAFANCEKLTDIYYTGSETEWQAIKIAADNEPLTNAAIHYNYRPVVDVTGIALNKTALSLKVGAAETLTATIAPENATDKTVTWTSSKPEVATVDANGKVTAVVVGEATITAVAGDKTAECKVTVSKKSSGGSGGGGSSSGGGSSKPNDNKKDDDKKADVKPNDDKKEEPKPTDSKITASNINTVFANVKAVQWYDEAVAYVYNNGIMKGSDNGGFAPNQSTTRGQIATMLYRLENEPAAGAVNFTDVKPGQWYAPAVAWAAEQKIVFGYANGAFGPEDNVTREQLAAILYRYAEAKQYDVTAKKALTGFSDGAAVSGWAAEAMQWAVGSGLLNGSDGALNPQGYATRAEIAAILMRFCENIAK